MACGGQRVVSLGEVRLANRLRQADEPAPLAHAVGQHLGQGGRERVDQPPHERAKRTLRESLGERVHRHQPAGVEPLVLVVLDDLVVGLLEHCRALVPRDTPVQHEPLAALEDASQVTPAEPARGGVPARIPQHHGERQP